MQPARAAARRGASPRCRRAGARARARPRLRRGAAAAARCSTDRRFTEIVGVDVSYAVARDRRTPAAARPACPSAQRERIELLQGSLDLPRRAARGLRRRRADGGRRAPRPAAAAALRARASSSARGRRRVVVTTPNREYNVRFETLPAGRFRHPDHRFEWTRAEFRGLGRAASPSGYGYARRASCRSATEDARASAPPTQMAVFRPR